MSVYRWVSGKISPSIDHIDRICSAVPCTKEWLLTDHEDTNNITENNFHGRKMTEDEIMVLNAYSVLDAEDRVQILREITKRINKSKG